MIPIFICEDNAEFKNKITGCVENYISMANYDMKVAVSSKDPYEILERLKEEAVTGIYFLDIELERDIDGVKLAEEIRKYDPRGFIVFVTTHTEYLQFTFEYKVEALDYIIKDDLDRVRQRICRCLDNINLKHMTETKTSKRFSFKFFDNKIISVDYDRIMYFENSTSASRKVILNSQDGRYEFYAKLNDIQNNLDSDFFRCHKSFIVNVTNIAEIDFNKKELLMKDGSVCYVALRQIHNLKERITLST